MSVVFVDGSLHVPPRRKLNDTFVPVILVCVSVANFPGSTHQVLQVLPGDPGGEVLHDHPVLGPLRGPVLVHPRGTASPLSIPAPVPPGATGKLNGDPFSQEAATVHVVNSVISIPVVIVLNESVASLHENVPEPAEGPEFLLQVPLPAIFRKVANIYPCTSGHRELCLL